MVKISVIIPTYNRAHLLGATIESVLAQSFVDFELIVVDDGSTDATARVIKSYQDSRLRYIYQENQGGSAARNLGAQQANAAYLLFLDSDDLLLSDALENLWAAAQANPYADIVAGGYEYVNESGDLLGQSKQWLLNGPRDMELWALSCPLIIDATLVRRDCFQKVKGFDPEQEAAQDWDLWLRMAAMGCSIAWLQRVVTQYRLHQAGLTANLERQKRGYMRALEKYFSESQTPPFILAMRDEVYANANLYLAAREYAVGQYDHGQADLKLAGECLPEWVDSGILLERLLRMGQSPIITTNYAVYSTAVLDHLPANLFTAKSKKRALARVAAASLFANHGELAGRELLKLWLEVVFNDPSWLRNRGFLSLGAQGMLGGATVSKIKRIIHR